MVNTFSRNSKPHQLSFRAPRTPISAYRHAFTAKNLMVIVIIAAIVIVMAVAISIFFLNPERRLHADLESLAANYYENVFYEGIITSDHFSGDTEQVLAKYTTTGVAPITLRQLSLIEPNISTDYLLSHCDETATTVTFFPESPYSRTSYHTEYSYACNY